MGLFTKKKKSEDAFEKPVSFVTDKNGDKYFHIKEFSKFLSEYKNQLTHPNEIALIDQLVEQLNQA